MEKIIRYSPAGIGFCLALFLWWLNNNFCLNYGNIKGFENILESIVNFLSIVIGFYSAFYGMIISMTKTRFLEELKKSEYKEALPNLLIMALLTSFLALILTILLQILINYENNYILYLYYLWGFLVGSFITYSFRTALLSIAMIFGSDPDEMEETDV